MHTGGGLVLLLEILKNLQSDDLAAAWLDIRARDKYEHLLDKNVTVYWVKPSFKSRIFSEWTLFKAGSHMNYLLCFHSLPPLFRNQSFTIVFHQNRNYFEKLSKFNFIFRTKIRIYGEKLIGRIFRKNIDKYFVQTQSMADALKTWWGNSDMPQINILGFSPIVKITDVKEIKYDFIYVADGEAHKNHRNLVDAWILLSKENFYPSLALTLANTKNFELLNFIRFAIVKHKLNIFLLPSMSHSNLISQYSMSSALVFPSLFESYGLPLIEAQELKLPILASELDYVRDVCEPVETFDPLSPRSISRAILRFMKVLTKTSPISTTSEFLKKIIEKNE